MKFPEGIEEDNTKKHETSCCAMKLQELTLTETVCPIALTRSMYTKAVNENGKLLV